MKLDDFSVDIPEGNEAEHGYVELRHAGRYTLRLGNDSALRCDAVVETDGKEVGKWRVDPYSFITLERPVNDTGHFTFYVAGTAEAKQAGIVRNDQLGLLKVTFTPEKKPQPVVRAVSPVFGAPDLDVSFGQPAPAPPPAAEGMAEEAIDIPAFLRRRGDGDSNRGHVENAPAAPRRAGGTGLSGRSSQLYHDAPPIDYDENNQVVIHLRLVEREDNTPRPLRSVLRQTPVPPLTQ